MKKETNLLRCDFSDAEIKEFASELAREIAKLTEAQEQKKMVIAEFADRIQKHTTISSSLSRKIVNGYEMRLTECEIRFHKPSKGIAQIVRLDTGELVKERPMDNSELQEQLFKDDGEAKAAKTGK